MRIANVTNGSRCWCVHVLDVDVRVRVHTGVRIAIAVRFLQQAVSLVSRTDGLLRFLKCQGDMCPPKVSNSASLQPA